MIVSYNGRVVTDYKCPLFSTIESQIMIALCVPIRLVNNVGAAIHIGNAS